ncbi:hypothetical protein Q4574_04585 [Aliiglaciecola sp. 3_MG-2023]|uniref:hypothetical protein n=1 Tax=Aliiglaciecola sp. 3_MG-2023 TaxID=3062644 RepID=UPI0026E1B8F8|nr:hypothetical protein [Aliiglaciecola sp. 3_MG-2023]MDO6692548.1 hypothetical protein [Aliiglaciecola sp. 3_MG-2023]
MNPYSLLIILLAVVSCTKQQTAPTRLFDVSIGVIDLSRELMGNWEKVCFITPYTNNDAVKQLLGFNFDVENKSAISVLDSITLVVTVNGNQVTEYFETPRHNIDFSSLQAKCFTKSNARFKIVRDENGWPNMQHS